MNIVELYNPFGEIKENTWLNGRSYSDAFVICIGAGPWRENRRKNIQEQALIKLNNRDISELSKEECDNFYPLNWQNEFLLSMRNIINNSSHKTFESFCKKIKNEFFTNGRYLVYTFCGCPLGAKVLSLFCRDALKIKSFPIDRHVKRWLKEHNLPQTEDKIIKLCDQNDIDARLFALDIAQKMGIKNPDWSIK